MALCLKSSLHDFGLLPFPSNASKFNFFSLLDLVDTLHSLNHDHSQEPRCHRERRRRAHSQNERESRGGAGDAGDEMTICRKEWMQLSLNHLGLSADQAAVYWDTLCLYLGPSMCRVPPSYGSQNSSTELGTESHSTSTSTYSTSDNSNSDSTATTSTSTSSNSWIHNATPPVVEFCLLLYNQLANRPSSVRQNGKQRVSTEVSTSRQCMQPHTHHANCNHPPQPHQSSPHLSIIDDTTIISTAAGGEDCQSGNSSVSSSVNSSPNLSDARVRRRRRQFRSNSPTTNPSLLQQQSSSLSTTCSTSHNQNSVTSPNSTSPPSSARSKRPSSSSSATITSSSGGSSSTSRYPQSILLGRKRLSAFWKSTASRWLLLLHVATYGRARNNLQQLQQQYKLGGKGKSSSSSSSSSLSIANNLSAIDGLSIHTVDVEVLGFLFTVWNPGNLAGRQHRKERCDDWIQNDIADDLADALASSCALSASSGAGASSSTSTSTSWDVMQDVGAADSSWSGYDGVEYDWSDEGALDKHEEDVFVRYGDDWFQMESPVNLFLEMSEGVSWAFDKKDGGSVRGGKDFHVRRGSESMVNLGALERWIAYVVEERPSFYKRLKISEFGVAYGITEDWSFGQDNSEPGPVVGRVHVDHSEGLSISAACGGFSTNATDPLLACLYTITRPIIMGVAMTMSNMPTDTGTSSGNTRLKANQSVSVTLGPLTHWYAGMVRDLRKAGFNVKKDVINLWDQPVSICGYQGLPITDNTTQSQSPSSSSTSSHNQITMIEFATSSWSLLPPSLFFPSEIPFRISSGPCEDCIVYKSSQTPSSPPTLSRSREVSQHSLETFFCDCQEYESFNGRIISNDYDEVDSDSILSAANNNNGGGTVNPTPGIRYPLPLPQEYQTWYEECMRFAQAAQRAISIATSSPTSTTTTPTNIPTIRISGTTPNSATSSPVSLSPSSSTVATEPNGLQTTQQFTPTPTTSSAIAAIAAERYEVGLVSGTSVNEPIGEAISDTASTASASSTGNTNNSIHTIGLNIGIGMGIGMGGSNSERSYGLRRTVEAKFQDWMTSTGKYPTITALLNTARDLGRMRASLSNQSSETSLGSVGSL
ncbi:hypothetical protein HDU76_011624 [Blyttiomyces sp. JEL0837]|nr:hypothetical protein HDU76_011624 [Blyttiomyces sp. JEL0837]